MRLAIFSFFGASSCSSTHEMVPMRWGTCVAAHQMRELGAPTCAATADAAAEQLQATLLYLVRVLG